MKAITGSELCETCGKLASVHVKESGAKAEHDFCPACLEKWAAVKFPGEIWQVSRDSKGGIRTNSNGFITPVGGNLVITRSRKPDVATQK